MKKEKIDLETARHSLSHILAAAVLEMFPEAKLAIGPSIENGFYYDFELPRTLIPEDLPILEGKMKKLIDSDLAFEKAELDINKAQEKAKKGNQSYKIELLKDLKKEGEKKATFYKTGDFIDLCRGPHVKSTKDLQNLAFKLDKIAGAYWKGNEKNIMLQRIYGLAFTSDKELHDFIENRDEAKKRDHRILGEKLELFVIRDEIGAGLPLWLPKGTLLRSLIKDYMSGELKKAGYKSVETPHIAKYEIWKQSGHTSFYKENMYSPFRAEDQQFIVKPMNCPFHIYIYKSKLRSHRELPVRLAEFGTVYRFEKSGVLHGLMRVRGFTQDDAHIMCREDQMENEIANSVKLATQILKKFGFDDYEIYLSTRPERAIGSDEIWEKATEALKKSLEKNGLKYQTDPGEGVFYGPKIDIKVKDSLGRAWQCTTIQVDFNLPEKFDVTYVDEKGEKRRAVMIHHALLGSLERFIGVLIEHYAGAFPVWLAPLQAVILTISDKQKTYAKQVMEKLEKAGVRVELDERNESIGKKIREAELKKVPYMVIIGEKEKADHKVAVRRYGQGDQGQIKIDELVQKFIIK